MEPANMSETNKTSRRGFMATAAAAAAAGVVGNAFADGKDEIRVGLIGCGGRGSGAGENVLMAAPNVKIVALADVFGHRIQSCTKQLLTAVSKPQVRELGNTVELPDANCFVGLDAYEKLLALSD